MLQLRDYVWLILGSILPSALCTLAMGYVVRKYAPRLGLLDFPGGRKSHTKVTPTGGGIAILAGIVFTWALVAASLAVFKANDATPAADQWLEAPAFLRPHLSNLAQEMPQFGRLIAAAAALALLGLCDDRWKLDWRLRLFAQFGIAAWCVYSQRWAFPTFWDRPTLTNLLSVLWIVTLINAFNMLDNMDGLAASMASLISATLAAVVLSIPLAQPGRQLFVAAALLVLTGSLAGFLWHNRPPAKLFMGDAGSYLVGFALAIATLVQPHTPALEPARHTFLAPLCVMAVPLYDLLSVVLIRIWNRRSPFHADRSHFSFRLADLGYTRFQAVLTVLLTTATCCLAALLLPRVDTPGAAIIMVLVVCVLLLVAILEWVSRRKTQIR